MEKYKVITVNGLTIIERIDHSFKMSVNSNRQLTDKDNTALLEATLYKEDGSFVKDRSYIFEALDTDNKPLVEGVQIDIFKVAVDFFFMSILNTENYIKSIPKVSSLCPKEIKLFQYEV